MKPGDKVFEFDNTAHECIYNGGGFCNKGLPGTPCDLRGCVAFYPKGEAMAKMQFYHQQQMIEMDKHME